MKYLYTLLFIGYFCSVTKAAEQTLTIVTEHWPPYIVQSSETTPEISGIVTDKINAIFNNSNINYNITVYPWARSYYLAKNQPNTLIYSIFKTDQRSPHFKWFCSIHPKTPVNIYKLKTNKTDINQLVTMKNSIVGVLRDDNSHNFMLKNGFVEGKNLLVSASEESNIKKLINGKIDAVIQSHDALIYRIKDSKFKIDDFDIGFQLHKDSNTENCMALSLNSDPKLVSAVEQAFSLWKKHN